MIDNKITQIQANIGAAQEHLAEIEAAMELLEKAGMYPAVPHFQWQDRGSDGKYLYCIFRQNGDGSYTGPDGKKKIYIGANPDKVKEARRLTQNREAWERLKEHKYQLSNWIMTCQRSLQELDREAGRLVENSRKFPKVKLAQIGAAPVAIPN